MPDPPAPVLPLLERRTFDQIGIVVPDLDAALASYAALVPATTWSLYTYDRSVMSGSTYRERPGEFSMRLALSSDWPQIELIEPLAGPSIYREWLDERGAGLHHLGFLVGSIDHAISTMIAGGCGLLQSGRGYGAAGDGGFAYFDTAAALGVIVETIERPRERRAPERVVHASA